MCARDERCHDHARSHVCQFIYTSFFFQNMMYELKKLAGVEANGVSDYHQ